MRLRLPSREKDRDKRFKEEEIDVTFPQRRCI